MSGKKQHFIPRRFVKNFSEQPETKNPKIWLYRYEQKPYSTGINDAPAQRYFYSETRNSESSETLDDKITDYEGNTITPILTTLERLAPDQQIDSILPAKLISHLIIRNDHFRKLGASVLESAFGALQNFSPTREYIKQTMGIDLTNPSGLFNQCIMEVIRENFPTANEEQLKLLKTYVLSNVPQKYLKQGIDVIKGKFKFFSEEIASSAELQVKEALTQSLSINLEPSKRINDLKSFNWEIFQSEKKFILPDCIAICRIGISYHSLIEASADEMDRIYFPISKDKMLVGFKGIKPEIRENINLLFAENSWDFFIAPNESRENAMLAKSIRKNPLAEINLIVEDVEKKILEGTLFQ